MPAPLELVDLRGTPGDCGVQHGRAIAALLAERFREPYIAELCAINRTDPDDLDRQSASWLSGLPDHFAEEIDGMAMGAGITTAHAARFLYADISKPSDPAAPASDGPMCSAVVLSEDVPGEPAPPVWVARNCDWLTATLARGTSAVAHAVPGRIPVLGVGIRGDIDIDTGLNAAGLWLHLHTLVATDPLPPGSRPISWLFWAREALETCSTLGELDAFIARTSRDRGVIAVAAEAATGQAAIFECGRASHRRVDLERGPSEWTLRESLPDGCLAVTNHSLARHFDAQRELLARPGSTVDRWCGLRALLRARRPRDLPMDLVRMLAHERVEMRLPPTMRTIYSTVCCPATGELLFAAGTREGLPAASTGAWTAVPLPWTTARWPVQALQQ